MEVVVNGWRSEVSSLFFVSLFIGTFNVLNDESCTFFYFYFCFFFYLQIPTLTTPHYGKDDRKNFMDALFVD